MSWPPGSSLTWPRTWVRNHYGARIFSCIWFNLLLGRIYWCVQVGYWTPIEREINERTLLWTSSTMHGRLLVGFSSNLFLIFDGVWLQKILLDILQVPRTKSMMRTMGLDCSEILFLWLDILQDEVSACIFFIFFLWWGLWVLIVLKYSFYG